MALKEITVQPRPSDTHNDAVLTLDKRRYRFAFFTNRVDDSWYFAIVGAFDPIALANGPDLLEPYRHLGVDLVPPGPLWIDDQGLDGRDPDEKAFADRRAVLLYEEAG